MKGEGKVRAEDVGSDVLPRGGSGSPVSVNYLGELFMKLLCKLWRYPQSFNVVAGDAVKCFVIVSCHFFNFFFFSARCSPCICLCFCLGEYLSFTILHHHPSPSHRMNAVNLSFIITLTWRLFVCLKSEYTWIILNYEYNWMICLLSKSLKINNKLFIF